MNMSGCIALEAERFERNFVGGNWIFSELGYQFDIYDPSNSEVIAAVPLSSRFDVARTVAVARSALAGWSVRPKSERLEFIFRALELFERSIDEIAETEARDTGTPVIYLRRDIAQTLSNIRARFDCDEVGGAPGSGESAGVVGVILSWSGPFDLCCRELLPALVAGHTIVAKPSLRAPLSCVLFAEILGRAMLPPGVLNLVQGTGIDVGAALAGQSGLSEVWFQGGRATAKSIQRAASTIAARVRLCLRRPNLTLVDSGADLHAAVDAIVQDTLVNAGRAGYGGTVVHAHQDIFEPLKDHLEIVLNGVRYGPPKDPATSLGPMISEDARSARRQSISSLEAATATCIYRGTNPDARTARMGWFAAPQILLTSEFDHLANAELPLGPTIVMRVVPEVALDIIGDDQENGWNTKRFFHRLKKSRRPIDQRLFLTA
jgi:aldehyde dehydrogenase (NAD+)